MAALTEDRKIETMGGVQSCVPGLIGASVKAYQGGMVCRNAAGYLVPASDSAGLKGMGFALETVDNSTGAAGAKVLQFGTGVVKLKNDGTNPVTQANVGGRCWVQDDQTVRGTAGTNTVIAGVVYQLQTDGVLVKMAPELTAA